MLTIVHAAVLAKRGQEVGKKKCTWESGCCGRHPRLLECRVLASIKFHMCESSTGRSTAQAPAYVATSVGAVPQAPQRRKGPFQEAEPLLKQLISDLLASGDMPQGRIVDAGAQTGEDACSYAKSSGRTVHALDPVVANVELIRARYEWLPTLRAERAALGEQDGFMWLQGQLHAGGQLHATGFDTLKRDAPAEAPAEAAGAGAPAVLPSAPSELPGRVSGSLAPCSALAIDPEAVRAAAPVATGAGGDRRWGRLEEAAVARRSGGEEGASRDSERHEIVRMAAGLDTGTFADALLLARRAQRFLRGSREGLARAEVAAPGGGSSQGGPHGGSHGGSHGNGTECGHPVPVRSLDSLFSDEWVNETLGFAHLDVEQMELRVLRGGARTIRR